MKVYLKVKSVLGLQYTIKNKEYIHQGEIMIQYLYTHCFQIHKEKLA